MRFLALALFLTLAGCSRHEHLSTNPSEAQAQIQRWVPVGCSSTDARRIMEQQGFTCSPVMNAEFGIHRGADYVLCERRDGGTKKQQWQATLVLVEGKIWAVNVTTRLIEP